MHRQGSATNPQERNMAWTRPTVREVCLALEINAYAASEI